MADTQYDLSEKEVKLFEKKHKQRQESKAYFAKFMHNPHRPIGDAGPFDPLVMRYGALQSYQAEYFAPTPKNLLFGICTTILPILVLSALVKYQFNKKEKLYRSGTVAYKDRPNKVYY